MEETRIRTGDPRLGGGGAFAALTARSDQDAEAPPLKRIQGIIRAEGCACSTLTGHVYDDVPAALARWRQSGVDRCAYSSDSATAQRDWSTHSSHGGLSALLNGHVDPSDAGGKRDPESYRSVTRAISVPADETVFFSGPPVRSAPPSASWARAPSWSPTGWWTGPAAGSRPPATRAPSMSRSPIPPASTAVLRSSKQLPQPGPRRSTTARWSWSKGPGPPPRRVAVVRAADWSLVNMTGHPEAVLARELALGYPAVARVTGLDTGIDAAENVVQEVVLKVFAENTQRLRRVVLVVIGMFPMTTTPLPPAHSTAWTCPSNCPEPVHTGTRRDEPSRCRRTESRRVRGRAPGRLSGRRRRPRRPGPLWR
ncbi:Enolase-phosphatase E1 [Streptomyces sp. enrichment culture]